MLLTILLAFYALVVIIFLDNTLREGETIGAGRWDAMRFLGLGACLAWPVLLAYTIVIARFRPVPQSSRGIL
ncbi:hypothetical protein BTR14_08695 [Rhizobium rhizosphaerae]|uniref:Uncharacterized protein n=1 Tax=Xaviernesmea rhizosphaerae TaxID=1672749 RepID=A0ABX3PG48_9HYPH|nr:hypothetical protein [Xaviernesmea rhizosphaerae]OQP86995.1 hypothetical protein BTR14_08695 [Xaviernesmea rhizosphaerae]